MPGNRRGYGLTEIVPRLPSQRFPGLRSIHPISKVVTVPVVYFVDLAHAHQLADSLDNLFRNRLRFGCWRQIVYLAPLPSSQRRLNSVDMVFHIHPHSPGRGPKQREWAPLRETPDGLGDCFLGELPRSDRVGAARDYYIESVLGAFAVDPQKHFGGRLCDGIGILGSDPRGFRPRLRTTNCVTVHFVCGDMDHPNSKAGRLERKIARSQNVGPPEAGVVLIGPVYVALRGEVHDRVGTNFVDQRPDAIAVCDIGAYVPDPRDKILLHGPPSGEVDAGNLVVIPEDLTESGSNESQMTRHKQLSV